MWLIFLTIILLLAVFKRHSWAFVFAFFAGLLLDVSRLETLGWTSLFLIFFVLALLLYERKFEIQTGTFVFISAFLGSLIYLWLIGSVQIILGALIGSFLSVFAFKLLFGFFGKRDKEEL